MQRDKDYFYSKAKKTMNEDDWNIAKFLRNQVNKHIRRAKVDFITAELNHSQKNIPRFWRTIKKVFPSKPKKVLNTIKLTHKEKKISPEVTASIINSYFINVGNPQLTQQATSQPQNDLANDDTETDDSNDHLQLLPVTHAEVYNLTNNLNSAKSSGLSNSGPKVIKDTLLALNQEFTHLINTSITTNTFPDSWKDATVIPIPKPGDPTLIGNYHPFSLLPSPGKILGKIIQKQLTTDNFKRWKAKLQINTRNNKKKLMTKPSKISEKYHLSRSQIMECPASRAPKG